MGLLIVIIFVLSGVMVPVFGLRVGCHEGDPCVCPDEDGRVPPECIRRSRDLSKDMGENNVVIAIREKRDRGNKQAKQTGHSNGNGHGQPAHNKPHPGRKGRTHPHNIHTQVHGGASKTKGHHSHSKTHTSRERTSRERGHFMSDTRNRPVPVQHRPPPHSNGRGPPPHSNGGIGAAPIQGPQGSATTTIEVWPTTAHTDTDGVTTAPAPVIIPTVPTPPPATTVPTSLPDTSSSTRMTIPPLPTTLPVETTVPTSLPTVPTTVPVPQTTPELICPDWLPFKHGRSCYMVIDIAVEATKALIEAECASLQTGARLASLDTTDKYDFIQSIFAMFLGGTMEPGTELCFWTDGIQSSGVYLWPKLGVTIDTSVGDFLLNNPGDACLAVCVTSQLYRILDEDCGNVNVRGYVCEWSDMW